MQRDTDHWLTARDYLTVGHVCHDLTPDGKVIGGAAPYTAAVAQVLGCRAAIVTSAAARDAWSQQLPGILGYQKNAPETTVFENIYQPDGRRHQIIHSVAANLLPEDIPISWLGAGIVHLGPIANEIDPQMIRLFSGRIISLGPQGWMRRWDADGWVYQVAWELAAEFVPLADVVFLSLEDLSTADELDNYRQWARTLVVTKGHLGCTVYQQGEVRDFVPPPMNMVDTTGAGDIFAAAFMVEYQRTDGDPWAAARMANEIAAHSVTVKTLPAKMIAIRRLIDRHPDSGRMGR